MIIFVVNIVLDIVVVVVAITLGRTFPEISPHGVVRVLLLGILSALRPLALLPFLATDFLETPGHVRDRSSKLNEILVLRITRSLR